jgi:hypothetical protein
MLLLQRHSARGRLSGLQSFSKMFPNLAHSRDSDVQQITTSRLYESHLTQTQQSDLSRPISQRSFMNQSLIITGQDH